MKAIAQFCYDRRRFVAIAWILLLVGLFALSGAVGGENKTEFALPGSESQEAIDLLEERGVTERTGFQGQIVFRADQGVNDPAVRRTIEDFFARVGETLDGEQIVSPYDAQNAHQISRDGTIAYAEVNLSDRDNEQYVADGKAVRALREQIDHPGLQVELGGDIFVEEIEFSSEFIGLIAAVIILLIAFGSLLAMGLPIVTALFGVGCGFAIIAIMTRFMAVPEFTSSTAAMIGIGVGIDYALIIVTRYRQGLHDGLTPREATTLALDTSGRAVVFAGLTVVISLLGIFLMNLDFMRAIAVGAVSAVAMTMLASITLLPALLGFTGRNIDRLGLPHRARAEGNGTRSFWYRWSRVIQTHPWPALVVSVAVLLALAAPVFALRLGFADAGNRGTTDTTRRAYDLLSDGFGPGFNGPILVVVDTPAGAADLSAVQQLAGAITSTEGVASVVEPQPIPSANLALITVFPTSSPQDEATTDLVHRLRTETIPSVQQSADLAAYTTGGPSFIIDFSDYMAERLPLFIGAVLLLSFLLLMIVFHSVVVPLKAVVMNMLSIGAAFGATVAVFQWGWGAELIGVGKEGPIEAWAPMMLFAIVFGLSMDYEVFLLTRVREEYDKTGDNRRAVADGLAATGRVISAAAAIMVCVFAAFVLGDDRGLKLFGFGLAAAVFIDATIVRLVLVPAAMELMGTANWWAPGWLVRYLPTIRVDTIEQPAPVSARR
jgi:putative drug exporter of the RND superfamily